jgi:hypothetical protein
MSFTWAGSSPAGLDRQDWWAARLSAYLRVDVAGNYSFQLAADDEAKLYINGRWVPCA